MKYNPAKIEKKWQRYWETKKFYNTRDKVTDGQRKNYMLLTEFAYPSGNLHIGHWYAFSIPDILSRYLRMKGFNVMYPTGFDAFGLPAENAAIKNDTHPEKWTKQNIAYMTKQLKSMGATFDWSRKVSTIDPDYYKWTQWIFLKLYEKGLAYRAKTAVNWCPKDKTVLANEQVIDGKCDRCKTQVEQKELSQWMFRITQFADALTDDMANLDWQETAKINQRNWIGRSEGAVIRFKINELRITNYEFIEVFTTRADTLFGVTAVVISPEIAQRWMSAGWQAGQEVKDYIKKSLAKRELERQETVEKTGVDTGIFAINPINNEKVPIWIADYVLGHYGTGAVMFVPAHDERDFEFAKKFKLPIKQVIRKLNAPIRSYIMGAKNISQNSLESIGVSVKNVTKDGNYEVEIPESIIPAFESFITEKMEPGFWNEYLAKDIVFIFKHKDGKTERLIFNNENAEKIDRLACEFNDQKYDPNDSDNYINGAIASNSWYKPIIVHTENGVLINSDKFDGLNSDEAIKKITENLKSKGMGDFQKTYRLHDWILSRQRYWGAPIPMINCPKCGYQPVSEKELPVKLPPLKDFKPADDGRSPLAKAKNWLKTECPKCGGEAERETDTMDTFVDSSWYFMRYADPKNKKEFANKDKMNMWLPIPLYYGGAEHTTMHLLYSRFIVKALHSLGLVDFSEPFLSRINRGIILGPDNQKMSKSRGNVVDPDIEVKKYGADAVRMFLAFMGPYEQGGPWSLGGISGIYRFLNRVLNYAGRYDEDSKPNPEAERILNKYIKEIGDDIQSYKFNTGVSGLMKLLNEIESHEISSKEYETFLKLLAPFAPHLAEELWMNILKNKRSIHIEKWPEFDEQLLGDEMINLVIQVNGKVRDTIRVAKGISQNEAQKLALGNENVKKHINGEIKKIIYVKDRIINFVIAI